MPVPERFGLGLDGIPWLWETSVTRDNLPSRIVERVSVYEKINEFMLTPFAEKTNTEFLKRLEKKENEKKVEAEDREKQDKEMKALSNVTGWLKRGPVRRSRK